MPTSSENLWLSKYFKLMLLRFTLQSDYIVIENQNLFRSSIGDAVDLSLNVDDSECRRRLEFSTGSSSGLGSSLNTTNSTTSPDKSVVPVASSHDEAVVVSDSVSSVVETVVEVTDGTKSETETDSQESDDDEVSYIAGEIESIDTQMTDSRNRTQLSVVAPSMPASTSLLANTSNG